MAYYQFDLNLTNFAALPADADELEIKFIFSETTYNAYRVFAPPFPASQSITLDTRDPDPEAQFSPAFELSATAEIWIEMTAYKNDGGDYLPIWLYALGPYIAGDEGTEVPPP